MNNTNTNILEQRGKLIGVVVNNVRYFEGTITVLVERAFRHPKYHKITKTRKKYLVQYDNKEEKLEIGTLVVLGQIAKKSKNKFLKIVEISRKGKN